ncbi:MAG: GNAT family N-acetyltransferase [Clostridia bacterium]|nr:GNAT family N-acetyltransferase [Clostridia bacterium]
MSFTILPYQAKEHENLVNSWLDEEARRQTGIENWQEDVGYWQNHSPETFSAIIVRNPEPVAAVYYFNEHDNLHIGEILVDPARRGQGIGTAVLKYLLYTHIRCRKATAVIFQDAAASRKAFRNAGFVHTSTHPDGDAEYYTYHRLTVTTAGEGGLEPWMYGETMPYRFVVIFARYQGKWLYARHKKRRTWETAGGHIELGETPEEAARRELWEETGAVDFDIRYAFDYHVDNSTAKPGDHAAGQVFLADIRTLGSIPESEMAEVSLWEKYPPAENLTYPAILPVLFRSIENL